MKKTDVLQAIKFASVGLLNTAIDYGAFFVFFSLLKIDKNLAQILATVLAMTNSYLVNRYWTFERSGTVQISEIWRFITVNLLSLLTTLACLNVFYDFLQLHLVCNELLGALGIAFRLEGDSGVLFCKLLAFPFSLLVNFLGNRLWVFREKQTKK